MKYLLTITLYINLLLGMLLPLSAATKSAPPVSLAPLELLKPQSYGVYQDSQGNSHPWVIGQAHGLQWENSAYLPVGAVFSPQTWTGTGTDDDWVKDQASLEMLNKRGVHDLLLSAGSIGLTHVPPAQMQRILDYLEAHGFHYGLEIADFPKDPLIGYVVKPAVYRNPTPSAEGATRFRHIPGLADAFYVLVSPRDGEIEESGQARIVDGETAQVTLKSDVTDDVLLLYPQRLYLSGTPESRLPDLWQGYDEYRDRLLGFFSKIKLGPGFRFFMDPFTAHLGFEGEVENVIPTTDGFRLDFEAWLNKKYNHNVDDLNRGWGIKEHDLPDFAVAARSLPLWFGSKGVPAIYDPLKQTAYIVLNKPRIGGHVWDDFQTFRLDSVRGYMNAMANVLKKGVADVPVVYQWGGRSPLFTNTGAQSGFDGLSLSEPGAGVYAFAQAEDTPKTMWLIDSDTDASATRTADWEALKAICVRGFFAPVSTADEAKQLGDYGAALSLQAQDLVQRQSVLPYPAGVSGVSASLRRLSDGVWWLPSYRVGALFQPGDAFTLGPLLRGYKLTDPDGRLPRFVVWAPGGLMTQARLPFPKDSPAVITDPRGLPLKIDKQKNAWNVPVGADPIVISRVSQVPLPLDAADAAEKEANRLITLAKDQGIPVEIYQERLFQVGNAIQDIPENADLRYNGFARIIADLIQSLQPYLWIEGESASMFTFDSAVSDSEASGGSYLSLDTDRQPPSFAGDNDAGYSAEYKFSINAAGSYALWIAGTPPADASPFTYTLDNGGANEVQDAPLEGNMYAGKFVWRHVGDATLTRGQHTMTITVTGPRSRDNRYVLALDAFCLSRVPFLPNGATLPAIEFLPPDTSGKKGKQKK